MHFIYRVSKAKTVRTDAKTKCDAVGGRLFEPKTLSHNTEVATKVGEIVGQTGFWYWMGMMRVNGEFAYDSDGSALNFENYR